MIAIDPSPTGTGIVHMIGSRLINYWYCTDKKTIAKKDPLHATWIRKVKRGDENARMERLSVIKGLVDVVIQNMCPSYVGLEDYVYSGGGKSGGVMQIGELGGVIRLHLWEHGFKTRTYDPVTVKLAWTGKGNADKDMMVEKALKQLEATKSPVLSDFKKLSKSAQEAVADAYAVGHLLWREIEFRHGKWLLSDAEEHIVRVFNRVTKSNPTCLIDKPFMCKDG